MGIGWRHCFYRLATSETRLICSARFAVYRHFLIDSPTSVHAGKTGMPLSPGQEQSYTPGRDILRIIAL